MAAHTFVDVMRTGLIVRDPEISWGKPVFPGTRVPVRTLFDYLEGGDNLDEFFTDFPSVKREQAIAILNWLSTRLGWKSVRLLLDECVPRTLKRALPGPRVPHRRRV